MPRISAVIPVKNEAAGIAACLEGLRGQTVPVEEILVIDSGSTDGTQDIVRSFEGVTLLEIPPETFNHGATRNLGVEHTSGDFVLFTVGDARPSSNEWIQRLLDGFVEADVAAVSGVQVVPHEDWTNPLEWHRPVSTPRLEVFRFTRPEEWDESDAETRRRACCIDDVTALYRRSALEALPFRTLPYGEDMLFAIDALQAGHALVRNPAANVFHYHVNDYATTLKRTITVGILRYELFGQYPTVGREQPFRRAARLLLKSGLAPAAALRWWRYDRTCARAIADGCALVRRAVAHGPDALVALHDEYAGTPPIPLRRGGPTA